MSTYLFVSYTDFEFGKLTGAHKRMLELVKYLSENNKIIMISRRIPQLSEYKNIDYYYININKNSKIPMHIKGMMAIQQKLREIKSNIKYDYAIAFATVYAVCYKKTGYHSIITLIREDTIEYFKSIGVNKIKQLYFSRLEQIAVSASDKIIVQCQADKKNLVRRNVSKFKGVKDKVYVQINNINTSWMEVSPKDNTIDDDVVRIMFIGDFSNSRKGHSILLPAIKKLIDDGIKLELFIAGDGAEKNFYEKEYSKYSAIKFLGRINNVNDYLVKCDINIVPSLIDSCPNTILEGLTAEVATYGAKTGGIPDLLDKNESYMFEPNKNGIYYFLFFKIKNKEYFLDKEKQKTLVKKLNFDWGKSIELIIHSNS